MKPDEIRKLMQATGYTTPGEFARKLGVHPGTVRRWLHEDCEISHANLELLQALKPRPECIARFRAYKAELQAEQLESEAAAEQVRADAERRVRAAREEADRLAREAEEAQARAEAERRTRAAREESDRVAHEAEERARADAEHRAQAARAAADRLAREAEERARADAEHRARVARDAEEAQARAEAERRTRAAREAADRLAREATAIRIAGERSARATWEEVERLASEARCLALPPAPPTQAPPQPAMAPHPARWYARPPVRRALVAAGLVGAGALALFMPYLTVCGPSFKEEAPPSTSCATTGDGFSLEFELLPRDGPVISPSLAADSRSTGEPMPLHPFRNQARPPCPMPTNKTINGGCWAGPYKDEKAPCPYGHYSHNGECYGAVGKLPPQEPTTKTPGNRNPAAAQ